MDMSSDRTSIIRAIQVPIYLVLSIWIVHIFKVSTGFPMGNYGLLPRDISGAVGIFTSPFIHGSFQHLISNSVPLFILTLLILLFYRKVALQSMLLIYVLTGAAVWTFARDVIHIGASGVVYGLVSFVFWTGIFRRNIKSIILALIMTVLYGGYFLGVLPNQEGISWESHLCGGLVGILVAYWMRDKRENDEEERDPWKDEPATQGYFLPRDAFEMTRAEREQLRRSQGSWDSSATHQ